MNKELTFDEFKVIFSDLLGLKTEELQGDENILLDFGIDSLSLVNAMVRIEKKFDIRFASEDRIMTQTLSQAYEKLMENMDT